MIHINQVETDNTYFFNDNYLKHFYTTERYSNYLNGGGGPFGFDIQKSIEFNLLKNYYDNN